jgi:electron transport complex protein RnfC
VRKIWDFHGGIHPEQHKDSSNDQSISDAGIPDLLIFPLSQHLGAPAKAIVKIGDKVLKGQKIAAAKGFVSVPIHASSSGTVTHIEDRIIPHPSGMSAPCIVIAPDGKDEWIEHSGIGDYEALDKTDLLNIIRESGIAGMGGAGFPAAVKLANQDDLSIETLIINGTECEPYITSDDRLMRERADEIIEGTKILRYLVNPSIETLIGVEDNKPEAIAALKSAAVDTGIEIVSFPTKYPSGGEKQLIQILTGKEVPSGGLPANIGAACQNIGSTVAIYRAIKHGEPLISRITTVTGDACSLPKNMEVRLGSPVKHLLDQCEFDEENCSRLIMGGPMMGFTLSDAAAPVIKTTNCIMAPTDIEMPTTPHAQACIRCGMCEQACPVSLLPQQLYWFARGKEYDKLETHNIADCIECGACSFVCPSKIPLVQYYRASKADIREHKKDALNAEHSKLRFEARKARIEQQEAEKTAKRLARQAAAQARAAEGSDTKVDAVQAAIDRAKTKKAALNASKSTTEPKPKSDNFPTAEKEQLEENLRKLEKRLNVAKEKFQQAEQEGSDKMDAFRTAIEKTREKHNLAADAIKKFLEKNPDRPSDHGGIIRSDAATLDSPTIAASKADLSPNDTANIPTTKPSVSSNTATDAIAKALAKRAAASTMTELEKMQNAVVSIEKRITKTKEKLAVAESEGDEIALILSETVSKLTTKLSDAKAALKEKV